MLTLIFMRHGKASSDMECDDRQRPLTNAGRIEVTQSALFIDAHVPSPDVIVSSDALRAQQSAEILSSHFSTASVTVESRLYESYSTQDLINIIASAAGNAQCLAVVGHNPDITYRSAKLTNQSSFVGFPTAGVLALSFDTDEWDDIEAGAGSIVCSNFL